MSDQRPAARRWLAPEVIQTSAMDCGPAALKCLLEGHGVRASYGRLREACQTSVDGTSIDTLEELACALGLEAEQIVLPRENLFLSSAGALPALVVTTLPSGLTHFVVLWRQWRGWVQVMDPARGRRWVRGRQLLREVYLHQSRVEAEDFRAWAESDGFRHPLAARLRALGVSRPARLVDEALQERGWRSIAALDAAARAAEALVDRGALAQGRDAVPILLAEAREDALAEHLWLARPAADGGVLVRGAVAVRVLGRRAKERPADADVAAVLDAREPGPAAELVRLLRTDGLWRLPPIVAGLWLAAAGAAFEALLFRGFLDVGTRLPLALQRLGAVAALAVLVTALLLVEGPIARSLLGIGRRLELRLRRAFAEKIPRMGDRYFQSRPVSDMAERAHFVHWLRLLPGQGGQLVRAVGELVMTTAGIIWLSPRSAPLAIGLAAAMVVLPLAFQPALVERDLRMRSHAGGLARFYLDALLGLVPIRAHAAEPALVREHDERLTEWARAAWAAARTSVQAEAAQALVGFALAAALLFHYLVTAPGSGWALLLVYWALALPAVGQEIGFLVQQYPQHRNVALRLVEPLGAPEAANGGGEAGAPGPAGPGVEVHIEDVLVRAAGRDVLEVSDLHIEPGAQVAVVGASGAGKTSLAGMLLGWYEPARGRVLVDGEPLAGTALGRLRRQTACVEPGVYLWNRSLLENLRYGARDGDARPQGAAIQEAVDEADLDEVLSRLPTGLQTPLGEGGALLSGGEGQRVRLGRAIVRGDARLVILDEAFRGLERPRRRALLERARVRWRGATLLCITHDVEDTLSFDRALVVADGRIVEDGRPSLLAERAGSRYRVLLEADRRVRARFAEPGWRTLVVDGGLVRDGGETP